MIITISNLYPRPDQKTRGMFNFQLFREMGKWLSVNNHYPHLNLCLVPEWRIWRWGAIRQWQAPVQPSGSDTPNEGVDSTRYVPVFYLPFIGRSLSWWFYYRSIRKVVSGYQLTVIEKHPTTDSSEPLTTRPVILASWLYPDAVAAARVAKDHGFPVWLRLHGSDRFHLNSRYRRKCILEAASYARGVICNCNSVAEVLSQRGIPKSKIHIVRNGVDATVFHFRKKGEVGNVLSVAGEMPATGRSNNDGCSTALRAGIWDGDSSAAGGVILFIANLVPVKGPDIMLKAFAGVVKDSGPRPQTPNRSGAPVVTGVSPVDARGETDAADTAATTEEKGAREAHVVTAVSAVRGEDAADTAATTEEGNILPILLIIGSGPLRKKLERQARALGIADRVHFLGNRPHKEVALWMNRADCLCLTSRSEGMPNVVLESLASGLPVVATRVGACPELLDGEPAARLCPSEDVDAITEALCGLLASRVNRLELAAKYAASNSWSKQAETILKLAGMVE